MFDKYSPKCFLRNDAEKYIVVYTGGSVQWEDKSGCGFSAMNQRGGCCWTDRGLKIHYLKSQDGGGHNYQCHQSNSSGWFSVSNVHTALVMLECVVTSEYLFFNSASSGNNLLDTEGTAKTIFKGIQVDNTRIDETAWPRRIEFEIKCGSTKKGCLRGRFLTSW